MLRSLVGSEMCIRDSPILIASDYHQAVDWAQEICEREDIPLDYGRIPFSYKPDTPSLTTLDLSFLTYPGEDFPLPHSYLINDRILYFSIPEEIDRDLVDRLEREGEELMMAKSGQRFSAAESLLVECSLMKRISAPVRKYAARRFRSIINPDKKPNVYLFNQTNKGAAIIRLISPLLPLHLTLVKNVEDAVDRALGNRDRTGKSQQENGTACEGELLSVINLLSEIRWDQRGTHLTPDRDNSSMNILIEAVKLIKEELDGLLEEKENSCSRLEDTIESLREIRTIDIPLKELRDYLISLAQSPRLRQEDRAYLASMDERVMKTLEIIHRQPSLPGERENIFLT